MITKLKPYILVTERDPDFTNAVSKYITNGYVLYGSPYASGYNNTWHNQALVLPSTQRNIL